MGNWRTVRIVGTCAPEHLGLLRNRLTPPDYSAPLHGPAWRDHLEGPLAISHGVFALGDWPAEKIDRLGNLYERDYSVGSVAEHLKQLVGIAPSLTLKVHCGGEWEDKTCVATIVVVSHNVTIHKPEISSVGEFSEAQIKSGYLDAIRHARAV